jgi:hypothetical protein
MATIKSRRLGNVSRVILVKNKGLLCWIQESQAAKSSFLRGTHCLTTHADLIFV